MGSGRYVPGEPIDNRALARVMDTNDAWIQQRTGIAQRHFAPEGVGCSDLALEASKRAIEAANLQPSDIDYIVFCTMTPDYFFPGSGGLLGSKLGISGVPALDVRQQCAAMPFGLQVSNALVVSGAAKTVLLVGAEAHAGFMPWTSWEAVEKGGEKVSVSPEEYDRGTRHRGLAILFGDGAGALVLRAHGDDNSGFLGAKVHTDGAGFDQIYIEGGGFRRRPRWTPEMFEDELHIPRMKGRDLFRNAVTKLPAAVREVCAASGVTLQDVDWFIAHQANDRINAAVVERLGVDPARVPSNIARYGNTSGATIPILTDEMLRDGRLQPGQLICFLALGAGLNWGAALMRI